MQKKAIFRSDTYLAWVRTLNCANCGQYAPSCAHHRIGHGRVSTMKTSDLEAMPLCNPCHLLLHNIGWTQFEETNRCQLTMSLETINEAIAVGVLITDKSVAQDLIK